MEVKAPVGFSLWWCTAVSMTGAFRRLGRGAISGFYYYCHHSHHECCCYFVVHVIAIAAPPTNMNYAYCSGNMSSSVHTHSCRLARGEAKAPLRCCCRHTEAKHRIVLGLGRSIRECQTGFTEITTTHSACSCNVWCLVVSRAGSLGETRVNFKVLATG